MEPPTEPPIRKRRSKDGWWDHGVSVPEMRHDPPPTPRVAPGAHGTPRKKSKPKKCKRSPDGEHSYSPVATRVRPFYETMTDICEYCGKHGRVFTVWTKPKSYAPAWMQKLFGW